MAMVGPCGSSWKQLEFFVQFCEQVELFNSGSGSAAVMFAIGRSFARACNEDARTIFQQRLRVSILSSALQNKQSHSTRRKSKQRKMRCVHGLKLASS
jgi:hypothetical protein